MVNNDKLKEQKVYTVRIDPLRAFDFVFSTDIPWPINHHFTRNGDNNRDPTLELSLLCKI